MTMDHLRGNDVFKATFGLLRNTRTTPRSKHRTYLNNRPPWLARTTLTIQDILNDMGHRNRTQRAMADGLAMDNPHSKIVILYFPGPVTTRAHYINTYKYTYISMYIHVYTYVWTYTCPIYPSIHPLEACFGFGESFP